MILHNSFLQKLFISLHQMIVNCNNSFIKFYKTVKKQFNTHSHLINKMQMFLNFSMQLMIKKEIDKHHYNLFITLEMTAFIADEQKEKSCKDIMLAFKKMINYQLI